MKIFTASGLIEALLVGQVLKMKADGIIIEGTVLGAATIGDDDLNLVVDVDGVEIYFLASEVAIGLPSVA